MREPSGLNTADDTVLSCPRRIATALPVALSQSHTVLSLDAVTMRDPPGLNDANITGLGWTRVAINLPVALSQIRAVLSADAVTMRDPSGLNKAHDTVASWP